MRRFWPAFLAACTATPAIASGPYVIDDAAIVDRDAIQVEAWWSIASGNRIANIVPAVQLSALPGIELAFEVSRSRIDGTTDDIAAVQSKWQLADPDERLIGMAIIGRLAFDLRDASARTAIAAAAATIAVSPNLALHVNAGHQFDLVDGADNGWTGGVRSEWVVAPDRLAIHAEYFASKAAGHGWQMGVRPTLGWRSTVDLELVAGSNLTGERARWITLGATVRS